MSSGEAAMTLSPPEGDLDHDDLIPGWNIPLVFLRETDLFGTAKPDSSEWLSHVELYKCIGKQIDASHLTGLQRVKGFWRVYLDNLEDKAKLMADGVHIRDKNVPVLRTNPNRLDSENVIKIRIKNIPLSVQDGVIIRVLTLRGLDVISHQREKLRIDGKLTNCETGDRLCYVSRKTLSGPLPPFLAFGRYNGRVIHFGQPKPGAKPKHCSKCLQDNHVFSECPNEWVCNYCKASGHRRSECEKEAAELAEKVERESIQPDSDSNPESDNELSGSELESELPSQTEQLPPTSKNKSAKVTIEMQNSDVKHMTPNKGKVSNVHRSPPTPVETLHANHSDDNIKKKKKGGKNK